MAQYLAPGVYVDEIDLSQYIPSVSTSVGAFVGEFDWGPIYTVTTVTKPDALDNYFGKPSTQNYEDWFNAFNFLQYSTTLKLVRAVNRATSKNATASGSGILINSYEHWNESYSDGSGGASAGVWAAKYPSNLGNSLYVSICGPGVAYNGAMTATVTSNASNAILTFSANTLADATRPLQVGDRLRVGANTDWIEVIGISTTGTTVTVNNANLVVNAVSQPVVARWEFADRFQIAPGTSTMAARYGGSNDEVHVVVVGRFENFGRGKNGKRANTILETYSGLSVAAGSQITGKTNYYRNVISRRSKYLYWMGHPTDGTNWGNTANGTAFTLMTKPYSVLLSGGTHAAPSDGDIIEAYQLFRDKVQQDVSLVMTGAHSNVVKKWVLENISEARGDCVTFMGPAKSTCVIPAAGHNPSVIMANVLADREYYPSSSYGFYLDNWKNQYDPYNDVFRWVPLDGDVAGLAARTDDDLDAWYSFAGYNRGQIKNVHKLAWKSDDGVREEMYPKGINPIVTFPNEGTILYGDRTMQIKASAFDRINVRRLFITIEKAISAAAKYLLFEFNDAFTRAQFVALIEPYLREIQGRRGIYDFRVVCDETNNPGEVIDRNEFVGDIYIKPAKSINFLQLNFIAVRTDVAFEEVVGNFGG
jgi:phage tail sheath protein FI